MTEKQTEKHLSKDLISYLCFVYCCCFVSRKIPTLLFLKLVMGNNQYLSYEKSLSRKSLVPYCIVAGDVSSVQEILDTINMSEMPMVLTV